MKSSAELRIKRERSILGFVYAGACYNRLISSCLRYFAEVMSRSLWYVLVSLLSRSHFLLCDHSRRERQVNYTLVVELMLSRQHSFILLLLLFFCFKLHFQKVNDTRSHFHMWRMAFPLHNRGNCTKCSHLQAHCTFTPTGCGDRCVAVPTFHSWLVNVNYFLKNLSSAFQTVMWSPDKKPLIILPVKPANDQKVWASTTVTEEMKRAAGARPECLSVYVPTLDWNHRLLGCCSN